MPFTLIVAPGESLLEARDTIRRWHDDHPGEAAEILLTAGRHRLKEALELDSRDSFCTWRGETGTVICGGRELTNLNVDEAGDWHAPLPDGIHPEQLSVDDAWAPIARWPLADAAVPMLPLDRVDYDAEAQDEGSAAHHAILSMKDDVSAQLPRQGFQVCVMKDWALFRQRIDAVRGTALHLANPTWLRQASDEWQHNHMTAAERVSGYRCWFEGHPRFIARPGDWAVDKERHEIIYRPRPDQHPSQSALIIPLTTRLISVHGGPKKPVRELHFCNLSLAHTAYHLPEGGNDGRQAAYSYFDHWVWQKHQQLDFAGGALSARHWHDGSLRAVNLQCLGYHGAQVGSGCRDVVIQGCQVRHCGGNGILVGTLFDPPSELDQTRRITVSDCLIESIGQTFAGAVGIWQGFAAESQIAFNRIRNLPYTGISMGWRWDSTPSMAVDNMIIGNHVSDVMLQLGDGGGIYTLGHQPGSMVRDNLIHGIARSHLNKASPNNGIYPDQGSSHITYTNNIIYDIAASPVRCHARGGMDVDVVDNVLVPGSKEVAGVMSPPYENRVYFRAGDESLTEQIRWQGNTILTPEGWAQASTGIMADRHFGPRSPWRERFELD